MDTSLYWNVSSPTVPELKICDEAPSSAPILALLRVPLYIHTYIFVFFDQSHFYFLEPSTF